MTDKYPDAYRTMAAASKSEHEPGEVRAVQFLLSKGRKYRTRHALTAFGRAFASRFVRDPVEIKYETGAEDSFNHSTREITLGKPELVRLLHEIGHAKFGSSEEAAAGWSLGLLMKADPKFIPRLRGHILENDPY